MTESSKLDTLLRSLELDERSILDEKAQVEKVYDERRAGFEDLQNQQAAISRKLEELQSRVRGAALRSGDVLGLGGIDTFRLRLTSEYEAIEPLLATAKKELESARNRMENVQEELIAVRIEIKKVEKVIENRLRSKRLTRAAAEESETDEMGFFRRKK